MQYNIWNITKFLFYWLHDAMVKQLSPHIRLNIFFITNNQNRQQNKLVSIVNRNDWIKHNYWPYIIFYLCFLNPNVYILKTEWCLDLYMAYTFLSERMFQIVSKMFTHVFILGWNMKHWTLLGMYVYIFPPLVFTSAGCCICRIKYYIWCTSPFK